MSVTTAIRDLIAKGFTVEQALEAAEAFEAAMTPQRTARQDRNARYYQNKKATKASEKRLKATWVAGERERMRLKMPMWRYAFHAGLVDELDRANRAGFGAMVALATKWGIPIPPELLEDEAQTERDWRLAGNRARAALAASPPPFMRRWREIMGRDYA